MLYLPNTWTFPVIFFILKQSAAGGCKDGAGSSRPSLPAVLLPPLSVPVPAGPSPALRTLLQAQARSTDQRPPPQLLTDHSTMQAAFEHKNTCESPVPLQDVVQPNICREKAAGRHGRVPCTSSGGVWCQQHLFGAFFVAVSAQYPSISPPRTSHGS